MKHALPLFFLLAGACSSSPNVASTSAAGAGGAAGDSMSNLFGDQGGSGSVTLADGGTVVSGNDGSVSPDGGSVSGNDGSVSPDGGIVSVDAGSACDGTLLFDDFERPDSDDVGGPEVPAGATWETVVNPVAANVPDYDIVDGGLVMKPFAGTSKLEATLLVSVKDNLRLRYVMSGEPSLDVRLKGSDDLLLSMRTYADHTQTFKFLDGSFAYTFDPALTYYVELIVTDVGTATATLSTGDYSSDGGTVLTTLKSNLLSPYSWDRVSIDVWGTTRVEEISLERFPCE